MKAEIVEPEKVSRRVADELDKRLEEITGLIKIWHHFYMILTYVFETSGEIPVEKEREFQKIKTIVAEKHSSFMKVIDRDLHVGQNILNLVKRVISLEEFRRLSRLEVNKILLEWHEANILLHETMGALEYRSSDIAHHDAKVQRRDTAPTAQQRLTRVTEWKYFNLVVTFVVLLVLGGVCYNYWDVISVHPIYTNYVGRVVNEVIGIFQPSK